MTGDSKICPKCGKMAYYDSYFQLITCRNCGWAETYKEYPEIAKKYHFIALISRMSTINRWSLMRNNFSENIQEHSYMVAVIAHLLALIENNYYGGEYNVGDVVLAALYHDTPEVIIGDLPTPVKYYNDKILETYKEMEDATISRMLDMLPEELRDGFRKHLEQPDASIHKIVKAADKLSAYIKCVEETQTGNREFEQAKKTLEDTLKELSYTVKSVQYFMGQFIPSISLSLDEIR